MDDIQRFLHEDLDDEGDITSESLFTDEEVKAVIISKEKCVVAGIDAVKNILKKFDIIYSEKVNDGMVIDKGRVIFEISGLAKSILKVERLILNIISRMSGIATETKKLVDICSKINPKIKIASTRKTTPGFRKYEKQAVVIGGGELHRLGLYDAVMIKDNHLKIAGSVEKSIKKVKQEIKDKTIEIEVENEEDALIATKNSVDIIMLDNLKPETAEEITKKIKKINPNILVEISGGINENNIKDYASFADRISLGYITNSVRSMDFSLEII